MFELITLILSLIGFIGMAVVICRKIPVLVNLSPEELKPISVKKNNDYFCSALNRIKGKRTFHLLLHKILSKFRILTLKTESKTNDLLVKLRKKSMDNKDKFSEDYWKKLKKRK